MKILISLWALTLFGLIFEGSNAQEDIDERFEAYLLSAMGHFSSWMSERGLDPTQPYLSADGGFWGENDKLRFRIDTYGKWYDGISKNIEVLSLESNLTAGYFYVDYSYGTVADIHGGNYSLNGSVINGSQIVGSGEFFETGRVNVPHEETTFGSLYVEDGYLNIGYMSTWHDWPIFDTIELESLSAGDYDQDVKELILEGMNRHAAPGSLYENIWNYFQAVLSQTPIEDIIGVPFPPEPTETSIYRISSADSVILRTRSGEVTRIKNRNGRK